MNNLLGFRWPFLALLLVSGLALGGCNTVSGMGEDVESAGEGISEGAEDVEEKL